MLSRGTGATLASLPRGASGTVVAVSEENPTLCNKLLSMGLVEGTRVTVLSVAPLGDPIKIQAMGYKLSLRKSEARHVLIQPD